jgi:hypothetical protein
MNRLVRGTLSGLAGTVMMTIPILVTKKLKLFHTPPPVEISANVARKTPLLPDRSTPGFPVVWLGAHLAYGAACATGYVISDSILRPDNTVEAGLVFGGVVWGVSYLGYLPALGLYPWPDADVRPRLAVMVVAHAVYGVTVAVVERRLR